MAEAADLRIQVLRTTVVKVDGSLTETATRELRNILFDLIQNHGMRELVVDLTGATDLTPVISAVLEDAQEHVSATGGQLVIRLAEATVLPESAELPDGIVAFVPIDQPVERTG